MQKIIQQIIKDVKSNTEPGYLIISDMVNSTYIKRKYKKDSIGYKLTAIHNALILLVYKKFNATIIKSVGDAIIAKLPRKTGLFTSIKIAKEIRNIFDNDNHQRNIRKEMEASLEKDFKLETKTLLHYYENAIPYTITKGDNNPIDLIGIDIDIAFRVFEIAGKNQIIATNKFIQNFLSQSVSVSPNEGYRYSVEELYATIKQSIKENKHCSYIFRPEDSIDKSETKIIIDDCVSLKNLKGLENQEKCFLLTFNPSKRNIAPSRIKLKQNNHAIIMVKLSIQPKSSENDIIENLCKYSDEALESEFTLCVGGAVYGQYDFFFRISYSNDEALEKFHAEIQKQTYNTSKVDIRKTTNKKFIVDKNAKKIQNVLGDITLTKKWTIILVWFEYEEGKKLFNKFKTFIESQADINENMLEKTLKKRLASKKIYILEGGSLIYKYSDYVLLVAESMAEYDKFIDSLSISNAGRITYIIHSPWEKKYFKLQYDRMDGIILSHSM